MRGDDRRRRRAVAAARQRPARAVMPSASRKAPCPSGPYARAGRAARPSAPKPTCAVRSAVPGASSGSAGAWPAQRLQRVADAVPGAVVDDQRRAAARGDPRAEPRGDRLAGEVHLDHRAIGQRGKRAVEVRVRPRRRPSRSRARRRRAPTSRSRQSASARWNWRIGSASKNSLATTISGPGGSSVDPAAQRGARPPSASACRAPQRRAGLDEPEPRRVAEARHRRAPRAARRASACRAPGRARPARRDRGGPGRPRPAPAQAPMSSPNIWLISGAVTKSPAAPRGSRVA